MDPEKPNVVITGVSGGLGLSLLSQLRDYSVTGVDLKTPSTNHPTRFVHLDLGLEESCRSLFLLLRELRPVALIHLAFLTSTSGDGTVDADRMWQVNVGGTARVMEALTEVNRDEEIVKKFIFLSCAYAYGPDLSSPASEDSKLAAHTLPFAIHKMESDQAVQQRAPSARDCSVYVLRPAALAGRATNFMLEALRGSFSTQGSVIGRMFRYGERNPCILPWGAKYIERQMQFVHVDDVARLIAYILRKTEPEARRLTVLNVASRGEPIPLGRCLEVAHAKFIKVPGQRVMRQVMRFLWKMGTSRVPPEAAPYLIGNQVINTDRLREFLGPYYEEVIKFTVADALADSFEYRELNNHDPVSVEV